MDMEVAPDGSDADKEAKFQSRSDKAVATIVLAIELKLLCLMLLLGDPTDPLNVWKKLEDKFQRKTWANKLALKRRLNSLLLKDGESVSI